MCKSMVVMCCEVTFKRERGEGDIKRERVSIHNGLSDELIFHKDMWKRLKGGFLYKEQ